MPKNKNDDARELEGLRQENERLRETLAELLLNLDSDLGSLRRSVAVARERLGEL